MSSVCSARRGYAFAEAEDVARAYELLVLVLAVAVAVAVVPSPLNLAACRRSLAPHSRLLSATCHCLPVPLLALLRLLVVVVVAAAAAALRPSAEQQLEHKRECSAESRSAGLSFSLSCDRLRPQAEHAGCACCMTPGWPESTSGQRMKRGEGAAMGAYERRGEREMR